MAPTAACPGGRVSVPANRPSRSTTAIGSTSRRSPETERTCFSEIDAHFLGSMRSIAEISASWLRVSRPAAWPRASGSWRSATSRSKRSLGSTTAAPPRRWTSLPARMSALEPAGKKTLDAPCEPGDHGRDGVRNAALFCQGVHGASLRSHQVSAGGALWRGRHCKSLTSSEVQVFRSLQRCAASGSPRDAHGLGPANSRGSCPATDARPYPDRLPCRWCQGADAPSRAPGTNTLEPPEPPRSRRVPLLAVRSVPGWDGSVCAVVRGT